MHEPQEPHQHEGGTGAVQDDHLKHVSYDQAAGPRPPSEVPPPLSQQPVSSLRSEIANVDDAIDGPVDEVVKLLDTCGAANASCEKISWEGAEADPFRHGEIYFTDSDQICKFLVVPERILDPVDCLEVMLEEAPSGWGMPMPYMTVSVESCINYFECPTGWGAWPEDWGESPEKARARFRSKVEDVMYGVCQAACECNAWLVSSGSHRAGGNAQGALVDVGYTKFRSVRREQSKRLVNLGMLKFGEKRAHLDNDPPSNYPQGSSKFNERFLELFDLSHEKLMEYSVPIGQKVEKRLIYRSLPSGIKSPDYLGDAALKEKWGHQWTLTQRSHLTHLVCSSPRMCGELKQLTEEVAPHVRVVCSGKDRFVAEGAINVARRGGHLILLRNSGYWVNCLLQAIKSQLKVDFCDKGIIEEHEQEDQKVDVAYWRNKKIPIELPGSLPTDKIIVVDALSEPSESVSRRLTKALTSVGGDEMWEMDFQETEKHRLRHAWELVAFYLHNAYIQRRRARSLFYASVALSFLTTSSAILLSASNLTDDLPNSTLTLLPENIFLPTEVQQLLALLCAFGPLLSTFVLTMNHRFNPVKRWATLQMAAQRARSEIYRYRTRIGQYSQQRNLRLRSLLRMAPGRQKAGTTTGGQESDDKLVLPARELFAQAFVDLESEVRGSEIKMGSLHIPSDSTVEELLGSLYDARAGTRSQTWLSSSKQCAVGGRTKAPESLSKIVPDDSGAADASDVAVAPGNKSKKVHTLRSVFEEHAASASLDWTAVDIVADNGIVFISAEDYVVFRLMPAIDMLHRILPSLERSWSKMQIFTMVGTLASGVLGILSLRIWIPIVVALVSACEAVSQFEQDSARLTGANNSLGQLEKLLIWWQSLSMVQKRVKANAEYLVEATEDAIEAETGAWTQGMLRRQKKASRAGHEESGGSS